MLHAIREYGAALGGEPGFKTRDVRWCIDLGADGRLLALLPLGDGKSGMSVERCPDMHAMNSGGKSHFLIESAQTIALHFKAAEDETEEVKKKIESARTRNAFFKNLIVEAASDVESLRPIREFLGESHAIDKLRGMMEEHRVKPTDWVNWRIDGIDPGASEDLQSWWRRWRQQNLEHTAASSKTGAARMLCLLSGESVEPLATHPKISGLSSVGGLSMGDVLVGCDKPAFTSFGLEQSANAAMSAEAAQQYVDGLNSLVKTRSRKLGNAMVVYWFKNRVAAEDDPLAFLYGLESEEQQSVSGLAQARKLLDSVRSGARTDLTSNHFYAMTLSGASGRVMVRDWMDGQFENLVENIEAWFSDLAIVHREGKSLARDPKFLAVAGALVRDLKDLPPSTTSTLWHSAISRLPIPSPLMAQALGRFRSALFKDEPFNHARMGLIKSYFIRKPEGGDANMKPFLNLEHPEPAYHCGRLLAVLAGLQRAALGDVGAGVVQRYYPSASQTPGLTMGRLIGNSRNHLGKLDAGLAWWYEQKIAEIMGRMAELPRTLDLEGQGLFALGYYQQLGDLRGGKKSESNNDEPGEQA